MSSELWLTRTHCRTFGGSAVLLDNPGERARTHGILTDLLRPYGREIPPDVGASALRGQSYAEMAESLIADVVSPSEPVDLLVLAFSVHDLMPGRATATYLSHVCPGTPLSFAVCDQGSATAFSGLRVIRAYLSGAGYRRALLIVVEQADLPYEPYASLPSLHRGVAMLYEAGPPPGHGAAAPARIVAVRQHADIAADDVPDLADAQLSELAGLRELTDVSGRADVHIVTSHNLDTVWPLHHQGRLTVTPAGQPLTGVWSTVVDELAAPRPAGLMVAVDYDRDLHYLCLTAIEPGR